MDTKKYNIVWFCTDQQRFDTISGFGNGCIKTPNIDRLMEEGVSFSRAYTQAPICTPSRACFLTGRYPRSTRATFNGNDHFSKDETLVTKIFADHGWNCGLVGKLHLAGAKDHMENRTEDGYEMFKWSHHPQNDWEEGIDAYQTWLRSKGVKWEDAYKGCHWDNTNKHTEHLAEKNAGYLKAVYEEGFQPFVGIEAQYHQTTWCVEEAIGFIEDNQDHNWLISINPFDPHHPIDPPPEFQSRIDAEDMKLPLWREGELDNKPPFHKKDYMQGAMDGRCHSIIGMSDEQKQQNTRDYYAQIELIDQQFGRLMNYLDQKGLRENTIVIYMTDHGELDGDHGNYYKGPYFYESLVHVPLIISCPGTILQNVKRRALVELVDLAPTLLELNGIEIPDYMQGKSFKTLLTDDEAKDAHKNSVYTEYYDCLCQVGYSGIFATMYYDGRFKIVNHHGHDYGELYDHAVDPNEFHNLWYDEKYRDLKHELIKKNFDQMVLNNADYVLDRRWGY